MQKLYHLNYNDIVKAVVQPSHMDQLYQYKYAYSVLAYTGVSYTDQLIISL